MIQVVCINSGIEVHNSVSEYPSQKEDCFLHLKEKI